MIVPMFLFGLCLSFVQEQPERCIHSDTTVAGKTADACTVGDYFGHLWIKKGEPQTLHHDHLISAPLLSLSLALGIACFCKIRGKYGRNDYKNVVMTPIFLIQYGKIKSRPNGTNFCTHN